jgi:hypothetical protein
MLVLNIALDSAALVVVNFGEPVTAIVLVSNLLVAVPLTREVVADLALEQVAVAVIRIAFGDKAGGVRQVPFGCEMPYALLLVFHYP